MFTVHNGIKLGLQSNELLLIQGFGAPSALFYQFELLLKILCKYLIKGDVDNVTNLIDLILALALEVAGEVHVTSNCISLKKTFVGFIHVRSM